MGGFKPPKKTYTLVFDEPEFAGLEVTTRGMKLREVMDINRLLDFDPVKAVKSGQMTPMEAEEEFQKSYEVFASFLLSWNLLDDAGEPVPPTLEAVQEQEPGFIHTLTRAWVRALMGVPAPLGQTLSGGDPSVEASLPMEPLSESQAS